MSNLILFKPEKQNLTSVGFVKDTSSQIKIRDVKNSYELNKALTIIIVESYNRLGIKGNIIPEDARDIKDLILTEFKNLSLDEIAYAFKLERRGLTWEETQHFQLFNEKYVGAVLKKYSLWKRSIKATHNISATAPKKELFSESEIKRLTSNAIRKTLQHFLEHLSIPKDYVFIYDELYAKGFLNQSVEFKKAVHKDAVELLELELKERKASNKDEHIEIKKMIENLKQPNQSVVISKCKELSIVDFFRKLRKDEKQMEAFKESYEITEN